MRMCLQAHPRAHIAAVHVPAHLFQKGRVEAVRVLTQERVQQQSGNIKLVSRSGTDLTGVKDTSPQAHRGPSCKQPSDHNFPREQYEGTDTQKQEFVTRTVLQITKPCCQFKRNWQHVFQVVRHRFEDSTVIGGHVKRSVVSLRSVA